MRLAWDSQAAAAKAQGGYVRERSADPYHTNRWTRLSRAFRAEHPLCAECERRGIICAAEVVDHINPWPICGPQGFYDRSNLQALCSQCNITKGNQDKKLIQQWKQSRKEATTRMS